MAIEGIGNQSLDLQKLMKVIESGQAQGIDLAKKMIKIAHLDKSLQNEAEGKGQNIDVTG